MKFSKEYTNRVEANRKAQADIKEFTSKKYPHHGSDENLDSWDIKITHIFNPRFTTQIK